MPTSTSQNTRLFAPQVILSQDTSRLVIKLKSGEGYTIPSGLTLGDVIRYDPTNTGYTLSKADTEYNAEVVGVIESISGGEYTVVTYGSVRYPTSRLSLITSGGSGDVDVLFLSPTVAGGLTGTIDISDGTEKIVKPVLQIAPNSVYNGIVLNYVGYKTGNQAVIQEDTPLLPVGSVMYGLGSVTPGINWIRIDTDASLNAVDYSELYSIYGTSYGSWTEKIVITGGLVSAGMVGKNSYNIIAGAVSRSGVVDSVDFITNSVFVRKSSSVQQMSLTDDFYIETTKFTPSSTSVYTFTVPAVSGAAPTQAGTPLVPYIKAYEIVSVKVPETITLSGLTLSGNAVITGTLKLGAINDVESYITSLFNRIGAAGIP
jgi:hypothetical protein